MTLSPLQKGPKEVWLPTRPGFCVGVMARLHSLDLTWLRRMAWPEEEEHLPKTNRRCHPRNHVRSRECRSKPLESLGLGLERLEVLVKEEDNVPRSM